MSEGTARSYDLVIRGGDILDGTGADIRRADVAVRDGRIAAIGDLTDAAASEEIEADGRLITPGFVDVHGHSDVGLYLNPGCQSKVVQGITTEVMGNCGFSPFPMLDNNRNYLLDPEGVPIDWATADEYFDCVGKQGVGMNAVPQVGHITVRAAVLDRADRPATPREIDRMRGHVRDAMEAGACGFSTGLDYDPSTVSDLEEIVALAEVAAEYDGFYSSHLRGYSRNVLNAVAEAIQVGRRTGMRIQISHLGVFGRKNWVAGRRIIEMMDEARRDGVRIACDMMPYKTKGAWWAPRAIFPDWAYDWKRPWDENLPRLRELLAAQATRDRLKEEIENRRRLPKFGFHQEFAWLSDWADITIHELPAESRRNGLVGMTLAEAAEDQDMDPCDLYFDLILVDGDAFAAVHSQSGREAFDGLMRDEWTMFGTDAIATDLPRLREPWNTIQPHPRHYGTFPRVFEKYVREEQALQLPEAVRRMTGLAADHFGLQDRGYLQEEYWADLVVLNPVTIGERASWRLPNEYPSGIEYVFVNGKAAVKEGETTGELGGSMLTLSGTGQAIS